MSDEATQAGHAFAEVARQYIRFIDEHATLPAETRPRIVLARLLELTRAALDLPLVQPSPARLADIPCEPPLVDVSPFDYYWETLEPFHSSEVGVGSLADDLADIYADLALGLALHDRGEVLDAVWIWKLYFEAHWGDHAFDAARALHRVITGHGAMLNRG